MEVDKTLPVAENEGHPCKKPWYEYRLEMERASNTLRHAVGSYAFDNDFAHVKGYMEGYLAGMRKMEVELDL